MKQGSYKILLLKLSGAALGLAVMLGLTIHMAHNLMDEPSADAPTAEEVKFTHDLNREFNIVVEGAAMRPHDAAMVESRLELHFFEEYMAREIRVVENLRLAIAEIASQTAIPSELKENILADLESQLKNVEKELAGKRLAGKRLNEFQQHNVPFIDKKIYPHSRYSENAKCDQPDRVIEENVIKKCEGKDCTTLGIEPDTESGPRGNGRNATEAFFWI